jgi:hypothetical protein
MATGVRGSNGMFDAQVACRPVIFSIASPPGRVGDLDHCREHQQSAPNLEVSTMKKLSLALAAVACAGLAQAGEYHRLGQLRCSDCHTMHASRQHNFNAASTDPAFPGGTATITPNPFLLVAATPDATCLACHDGKSFAPDVLGVNAGSVAAGTRSAGSLNELGTAEETFGHSLGATATPPGYSGTTWAGALECSSCHAVHGSRAYRNAGLGRVGTGNGFPSSGAGSFANTGATYNFVADTTAADPTVDVSLAVGTAGVALDHVKGLVPNTFETGNIMFGQGTGNSTNAIFTGAGYPGVTTPKVLGPNGMNTYCAQCHGNFHGTANTTSGVDVIRHPTSGVLAGATASATAFSGTYSGVADTDPMVALDNAQGTVVRAVFAAATKNSYEVGCLTCHKAHGNERPFGLLYPDHTGTVTDFENGDSVALADGTYPIRNLCITCHSMGRNY